MTDERSGPLFGSWLKETDPTPPDAGRSVERVMAKVPQTRQRGRWWPLPAFGHPVSTLPGRVRVPAPITATSGPVPARGSTMFTALRFIAASVVVALFGGFLLVGSYTTRQGDELAPAAEATGESTGTPATSVRTDILPGVALTVEEVEPGAFRIADDGVRDLASTNDNDIVAGHDGGLWLVRLNRFFRLGSDTAHAWATKMPAV